MDHNFEEIPIGRAKDLRNQQFGYLTVLYRIKNNKDNKTKQACKCDCGNIIGVIGTDLTTGHTKSCGCHKSELIKNKNTISEIGNRYGRLVVLERTGSNSERRAIQKCQCDCGNIIETTGKLLRTGKTTSCGCYMKEKSAKNLKETASNNFINELGNKYGKLTVIEKINEDKNFQGTLQKCQCECGNIKITRGQYLRNGIVSSCGCLTISKGELAISQLLQNNNIDFKTEYAININKNNYRYDFAIFKQNNLKYLIEYDGIGHYEPRQFGGISKEQAIQIFNNQQSNDKIKNQWCKEHNIPLIRIPYTHLNNLCLEDLLLETSSFRII